MAKTAVRECIKLFDDIEALRAASEVKQQEFLVASRGAIVELGLPPGGRIMVKYQGKSRFIHNASHGLLITDVLVDEAI